MAIWDEMKEYGVDQNTISYSSLLSRWQLARHREVRLRKQQGERGPRRRNARRRVAALRGGALQPRRVRPARAGSAGATAPDVTAASLQRLMYGCLAVRDHVLLRVILFGTYHHHLSAGRCARALMESGLHADGIHAPCRRPPPRSERSSGSRPRNVCNARTTRLLRADSEVAVAAFEDRQ